MRKWLLILAVGVGVWQWQEGNLPFLSPGGAFDEAGNPVVWIFTIDQCGQPCAMGLNQLKSRRVKFEEKRIDPRNDSDPNVKLWKSVGRGGFPLIVAGNERIEGSGTRPMHATMLGRSFGDRYLTGFETLLGNRWRTDLCTSFSRTAGLASFPRNPQRLPLTPLALIHLRTT